MSTKKTKTVSKKRGRKPKFTKATIDKLCNYIRQGNYLKIAAQLCDVTERSVHRWISEAKAAKKPTELQRHLCQSLTRAEAEAEAVHVQCMYKAAVNGDWRASAAYLERRHHARWGKQDAFTVRNVDKDGEDVRPVIVTRGKLTPEEWLAEHGNASAESTRKH